MKPKQNRKGRTVTELEGDWVDVDDLVKPGEIKQVAGGLWVDRTVVVLDPPEPIKKSPKNKPARRKK